MVRKVRGRIRIGLEVESGAGGGRASKRQAQTETILPWDLGEE